MRFSTILAMAATALLASAAPFAAPAADTTTTTTTDIAATKKADSDADPPFQITKLSMKELSNGNTTLTFTVHDPSEYGNATTTCKAIWSTAARDFPSDQYLPCGKSSFGWVMQSFDSMSQFTLGLQHAFKNPNLGPYPYNEVNNYAAGNVSSTQMSCSTASNRTACSQKAVVIKAPVYASVS